MTDHTLRQADHDLFETAADLRADAESIADQVRDLEERVRDEFADPAAISQDLEEQYERLKRGYQEAIGTAETFEHYGEQWGDGDECTFVLEELNGDSWAATLDAVDAEAARQAREDGSLPQGYGKVKALEYAVADAPSNAPTDPGKWPAPIVNDLFAALNDITAPSEVDLGNDSLASVVAQESETRAAAPPSLALDAASPTPSVRDVDTDLTDAQPDGA